MLVILQKRNFHWSLELRILNLNQNLKIWRENKPLYVLKNGDIFHSNEAKVENFDFNRIRPHAIQNG